MSFSTIIRIHYKRHICYYVLHYLKSTFYTPVSRRAVLCDWIWLARGHPHRFPHNNFSSVYRIFTKPGHMIPLWKGKNSIYFGVIRSKVKVTVTINRIFDNRVVSTTLVLYIGSLPNLTTWLSCGRGRTLFILGSLGQSSRSPLL
jgi:hypothetical protein